MYEKVNPKHPDKVADRIAGAIVDIAYAERDDAKIAVEVLLGHGYCYIIIESNVAFTHDMVHPVVSRIAGDMQLRLVSRSQDTHLAENQSQCVRCGDNGIFKGTPVTTEQRELTRIAKDIYALYQADGKYIIDAGKITICQSNCKRKDLQDIYADALVNPIGDWTGGCDVDAGATNRKLGSDMGDSVTGGGLHGKDLSKADVSVNIYAWLKAQETGKEVQLSCAIGDTMVDGRTYAEIVEIARKYIADIGGFERFAEWGLIR